MEKVAVVGGGVAGIVSAYILQSTGCAVTLLEKNSYLGGHTSTVLVPQDSGNDVAVDTGFIVCNDRTYPNFHRFLEKLNVPWRFADMSFSVMDEKTGLQYGSKDINTIFADRKNLFSKRYWRFLIGVQKFWSQAKKDVANEAVHDLPLKEYARRLSVSEDVLQNFILPISAAIWSTPDALMLDFPTGIFLKFYSNHGLLSVFNQPRWQTVVGGSFQYVEAFKKQFLGSIRLNQRIEKIIRSSKGVGIHHADGREEQFDRVVIATHADQVLPLLGDPTPMEQKLFGTWRYLRNETVLHTDESFLPSNQRAWSSWNYRRELSDDGTRPLSVTYDMNRLQGLQTEKRYLVTLNSHRPIAAKDIVTSFSYTHPHFTVESMRTQSEIKDISGTNRTYYAGSYLRFGFHEDAVMSATWIGEKFGATL